MKYGSILACGLGALALAACNPNVEQNSGSGTQPLNRGEVQTSNALVQPIMIGEAGPRFDACQATGIVRSVAGNGELPVRAAPFDEARQTGSLTQGDAVYICNRTHDQRGFGVVYAESGELMAGCGVSAPIAEQRRYEGPCESGWVSAAFIRVRSVR